MGGALPVLPLAIAALGALLLALALLTWRAARRLGGAQAAAPAPAAPTPLDAPPAAGVVVAVVCAPGAGAEAALAAARGGPPGPARAAGLARRTVLAGAEALDFGDDLLAAADWRQLWADAVARAADARPDGAFDALAFAVRAGVLRGLWAEAPGAVEALGARLAAVLEDAQRLGGQRLPVYLLLTGADAEPGLAALRDAARAERADDAPLGWSTPYGPDAPFDPRWAEEAAESLALTLEDAALDGLGAPEGGVLADRPQAALSAPAEVRALAAPLRALLGAAFDASALTEPAMFRGVYLVGGETGPAGEPAAFAAQLFARKIIPEAGLAAPARSRATRTDRTARRLRIAAGVAAGLGAAGLLGLAATQHESTESLALLRLIDRYAGAEPAAAGDAEAAATLARQTSALFDAMADIDFTRLETVLAPSSFATGIDLRLRRAVAVGFDTVALRAIGLGLNARIAEAGAAARSPDGPDPEALIALAEALRRHDADVRGFEALRQSTDASELSALSETAIGVTPPRGFENNYGLYIDALRLARPRDFDDARAWAGLEAALGRDLPTAFAGAYRRDALARAAQDIADAAAWVLGQAAPESAEVGARLDALLRAVDTTERLLADRARNWLGPAPADIDARLAAAAAGVGTLSFAPPRLGARLADALAAERAAAREAAAALVGFGGQPILTPGPDGALTLNPLYPQLRAVVGRLLTSGRLLGQPAQASAAAAPRPTERVLWADDQLAEAGRAMDWLQEATAALSAELTPDLRAVLLAVARARTEARVLGYLDAARRPLDAETFGLEAAQAEAQGFAAAAPALGQLREKATLLRLPDASARLLATAGAQAARLLQEADRELAAADLYAPVVQGFEFWDGEPGGAADMFGLSSDSGLAGLVREWRTFAQILGQGTAAPALDFLRRGGAGLSPGLAASAARWREVLAVLADYDRSAPRNDLADLERFILLDLNEMERATCADRLAAVRPGPSWFGARLAELRRAAQRRCSGLARFAVETARAEVADAFDAALAGRFPFAGAGAGAPLPDPGRVRDAADPDAVRRFFAAYGPEIARLAAPGAAGDGFDGASAAAFTAALDAARRFLGGDPDGGPPPPGLAFAVDVDFRTNQPRERGGDQVIEWTLRIGDDRLSSFEPRRSLIWRQGDPVELAARWARNAPQQPVDPARPDAAFGERAVRLAYDGPWALLALLAANAAPASDLATLPDPRPNALRLLLPLAQNPDAARGGQARLELATLYLRVEVRAVDPAAAGPVGAPLAMPVFPARGPGL